MVTFDRLHFVQTIANQLTQARLCAPWHMIF